jgi:hypothetical protein
VAHPTPAKLAPDRWSIIDFAQYRRKCKARQTMPREIARTADRNVALPTSGELDPRTVVAY